MDFWVRIVLIFTYLISISNKEYIIIASGVNVTFKTTLICDSLPCAGYLQASKYKLFDLFILNLDQSWII